MFDCPTCNQKNREGALFCEACGTYFHTGGTLSTEPLEEEVVSQPGPSGFPAPVQSAVSTISPLTLIAQDDGREFMVNPGNTTTLLGRSDHKARLVVDIDFTGPDGAEYGISRRHARMHFLNGHYMLEDLESLNGTYLNGRKLRPYLPEVLHNSDEVRLANLVLTVSLQEAPDRESA